MEWWKYLIVGICGLIFVFIITPLSYVLAGIIADWFEKSEKDLENGEEEKE